MVTQEQIESKNFTLYKVNEVDVNNKVGSKEYLAVGERRLGDAKHVRTSVISLVYFEDGLCNITNFFNQALFYREFFFFGKLENEDDLNIALDAINFELEKIDLEELYKFT